MPPDTEFPNGFCTWRFVDGDWIVENHCNPGSSCGITGERLSHEDFIAAVAALGAIGIEVPEGQTEVKIPCSNPSPEKGGDSPTTGGD
jgi:hypothetical protein